MCWVGRYSYLASSQFKVHSVKYPIALHQQQTVTIVRVSSSSTLNTVLGAITLFKPANILHRFYATAFHAANTKLLN